MIKNFLPHYSKDFLIFTIICVVLSSVILTTNNFSDVPLNIISSETYKNSLFISEPISEIEQNFSTYSDMLIKINRCASLKY